MTFQVASVFLISYLIIISNERDVESKDIDIYSTNLTLEWENVSVFYESCLTTTIRPTLSTTTIRTTLSTTTIRATLSTTTIRTTLSTTTIRITERVPLEYKCEDENYIGLHCNISNGPCEMSNQCLNGGICHPNNTLPLKYSCKCPSGYSGDHCKDDKRICKDNTCWHDGKCTVMYKNISIDNQTTFDCDCEHGYDGMHCELVSNMCVNITCENKGFCVPSYLNWSCKCLVSWYYGKYCEHKSTKLVIKQVLSKSFASIAITAIISVFLFVIIMDILKYVFKIDPVDRERRLMELRQKKRRLNKKKKKRQTKIALRFFYIA